MTDADKPAEVRVVEIKRGSAVVDTGLSYTISVSGCTYGNTLPNIAISKGVSSTLIAISNTFIAIDRAAISKIPWGTNFNTSLCLVVSEIVSIALVYTPIRDVVGITVHWTSPHTQIG